VQVSMSSLDVMLSVCVFSAEHIVHCWSARWGNLSVSAFEFCHARCPPGVARLVKDLIVGLCGTHFSVCGLLHSGR